MTPEMDLVIASLDRNSISGSRREILGSRLDIDVVERFVIGPEDASAEVCLAGAPGARATY